MKSINEIFPEINDLTKSELFSILQILVIFLLRDNEVGYKKAQKVLKAALKDPLKAFKLVSHRIRKNDSSNLKEYLRLVNGLNQQLVKNVK